MKTIIPFLQGFGAGAIFSFLASAAVWALFALFDTIDHAPPGMVYVRTGTDKSGIAGVALALGFVGYLFFYWSQREKSRMRGAGTLFGYLLGALITVIVAGIFCVRFQLQSCQ